MVKNFEDIFIRFDATHERDRHTDRQTDGQTPHDSIGRVCASHHKGMVHNVALPFSQTPNFNAYTKIPAILAMPLLGR